jgi:radical SAM superfamily enzyme YgiQ (UPF0313 family)
MISALSTAVAGSVTPGFDRCNSGKLKNSYRGSREGERTVTLPHASSASRSNIVRRERHAMNFDASVYSLVVTCRGCLFDCRFCLFNRRRFAE